jgi:hypothetical protein
MKALKRVKKNNLVICSRCQELGTLSVLGEISPDGDFVVMRFHNGYTKIKAEHLIVYCGACNTPNYARGTYNE